MKKLISVLFVLILLSPLACAYAVNEGLYIGTWVYYEEWQTTGDLTLKILRLDKWNNAYYIFEEFRGGKATRGSKRVGTWKMNDDESGIFIDLGSKDDYKYNAVLGLENLLLEVQGLKEKEAQDYVALVSDVLARTADEMLSATPAPTIAPNEKQSSADVPLSEKPTGVRIPAGEWVVGVDIPAGEYSVSSENKSVSMNFVVWKGAKNDYSFGSGKNLSYNLILNRNNNFLGKIILEEGNTMIIEQPIILDKPVSLDFSL